MSHTDIAPCLGNSCILKVLGERPRYGCCTHFATSIVRPSGREVQDNRWTHCRSLAINVRLCAMFARSGSRAFFPARRLRVTRRRHDNESMVEDGDSVHRQVPQMFALEDRPNRQESAREWVRYAYRAAHEERRRDWTYRCTTRQSNAPLSSVAEACSSTSRVQWGCRRCDSPPWVVSYQHKAPSRSACGRSTVRRSARQHGLSFCARCTKLFVHV